LTLILGGSRVCGFRLLALSSPFVFVHLIAGVTALALLAVIGRDLFAALLRTYPGHLGCSISREDSGS
jgi:hypothetical protein